MHAVIHAADVQDRDGGVLVMATLFGLYPFLLKLYADGGYQGPQFKAALQRVLRQVNLEIVKRSDTAKTFTVLPKRWIVERTIGWLNRCRRLAKDWECLNRKALAFLRWASPAWNLVRVGLEAGPLSQWLFSGLAEAGLPGVCIETRRARAYLKAQVNKTDRNDARGIAHMMRVTCSGLSM